MWLELRTHTLIVSRYLTIVKVCTTGTYLSSEETTYGKLNNTASSIRLFLIVVFYPCLHIYGLYSAHLKTLHGIFPIEPYTVN